jgi:hypothetical protein
VLPLVTVREVLGYLVQQSASGATIESIKAYQAQYGV